MYLAHYLFLKFCSKRYESFSQATSFLADLPNFNPGMPKFNSFARNSQTSYSKTMKINSVPNTSNIMYVYGFFNDFSKTLSNTRHSSNSINQIITWVKNQCNFSKQWDLYHKLQYKFKQCNFELSKISFGQIILYSLSVCL